MHIEKRAFMNLLIFVSSEKMAGGEMANRLKDK
jgi:hypothetical protein